MYQVITTDHNYMNNVYSTVGATAAGHDTYNLITRLSEHLVAWTNEKQIQFETFFISPPYEKIELLPEYTPSSENEGLNTLTRLEFLQGCLNNKLAAK